MFGHYRTTGQVGAAALHHVCWPRGKKVRRGGPRLRKRAICGAPGV